MARKRTGIVSEAQITDAIGVAVEVATDGDEDSGHRLNAVNIILGHAYDYDYPASPVPPAGDTTNVEAEPSRG